MTDQKTEQKPADHKAIREALEADPYLTANVAKDDLRALLAGMDEARAALSAAKAGGWQDISTAPEGTMILCANMNAREARDWCFVAWIAGGKVCGHRMDKPTHWRPLPNPPKEQSAGGLGSVDAVANPLSPT
jgi:hypothetical protein